MDDDILRGVLDRFEVDGWFAGVSSGPFGLARIWHVLGLTGRNPSNYDTYRDYASFLRSDRCTTAVAALGRWPRVCLLDETRELVGEFKTGDSSLLVDTLHSRPDTSVWMRTGPDTCLAGAVIDSAALAEAARMPPPARLPGEPRQAAPMCAR